MKRVYLSVLISIVLALNVAGLTGCVAGKVKTDPGSASKVDSLLEGAKTFGQVLATALDKGIELEKQLAAAGTIDPDVEPQIKQWLQDGKLATADFNKRIVAYDHFDSNSQADIAKFLSDAEGFVNKLNNEGILRIKNPRSQMIASGILFGASTAIDFYKLKFNASQ